jgi:RHS repeat-associated protein
VEVTTDVDITWMLERRRPGEDFVVFATGTVSPPGGVIGEFDPTLLLNGLYEIRLRATDEAAQMVTASVFVVVKENLKVGYFTVSFVDLEVPVAGLPIRITRTYDSRDKRLGDFGFGWNLDIEDLTVGENGVVGTSFAGQVIPGPFQTYCLAPVKPSVVTITLPDGEVHEFEPTVSPSCQQFAPMTQVTVSFKALPGTHSKLAPADGGLVYVVGGFPGPVHLFRQSDFTIYDPDRYRLTLPDGRELLIDEEDGLERLTDLNGNRLTISSGGITHSSGKSVLFDRDAQGRIESITDPEGNSMVYVYDGSGDLETYTDREENATTFTYLAAIAHHLDSIEDPRGITPIRNDYDPVTGRLIRHTDAFGKTIEYTHDLDTRQEIIEDREGNIRVLEYDDRGNVVRETDPNGKVIVRTFDDDNNRLSETDPHDPSETNPPTTFFTYDDRDNQTSVTDPEGNTTEFTYNDRDQVLTSKDPRENVTTNVYDANGNLEKTIDAQGNETTFTYDAQGNVTSQSVEVEGDLCVTQFEYDAFGNLTKEIDALGNESTFTYDTNGNRLTETRTRTTPTGVQTLVTTFTYDKQGRLTETQDPDGTTTRTVYDELGKQVESFDKLNRKTEFEYDDMGRLTKTTYPDLTTEEFTYDAESRRLTSKDREGRVTTFEYDDLGRLTKTIFPDTNFTENIYDDAGRLVETVDARGKSTFFEYDRAGRRTAVRDPLGNATVFGYDPNGNQNSVRDAKLETTTFEYDALNRRAKTIFPDGTFTETAYDSQGRRISEQDQAGKVTQFEYDCLGRLTKVIDALTQETVYRYDEVGNRTEQEDANNHVTSFEYDELGRETKRTLPDGAFETKAYDAAGNLKTWTKFDGNAITFDFDVNNRLIKKIFPDTTFVEFTYTDTGQRETVTDSRGITSYAYDDRHRLETLTYPDGRKLDYGYDANGNRTTLTATMGGTVLTTTYSYDDARRLDIVTDPNGGLYDFDWDPNGNRSVLSQPNGTDTSYTYDTLNRLTNLATNGPSGVIQSYDFTLGLAGNRERIDEVDGTVREYTYDDLYRLTAEQVSDVGGFVYQKVFEYDPVGNREVQTTTGTGAGVVNYSYDDRDRLLTENGTVYGWDDNGNLITKSAEATYVWDFENRLIRVAKNDGTVVTHDYDVDGNRVRTEVVPSTGPPTVTNFLVDPSGALSHVVAETDGVGNLLANYVRATDDLLALILPTETRYYHADGLGSIRFLTDESGNVTDSYEYTAFGELLEHVGVDVQPYQFAGEPFEANARFYYNRARWLDAGTGRFAGMDLFAGVVFEPPTMHKYVYGQADPVNRIDPTGQWSLVTVAAVTTIVGTLAAIATLEVLSPRSRRWFGSGTRILALQWENEFRRPVRAQGGRVVWVPLDQQESDLVKLWARQQLHMAFSGFAVVISEGGGTNYIHVTQDRPSGEAGGTPQPGLGHDSEVNYDWLAGLAVRYSPGASKQEYLASLGRGIGATAAHEFVHQSPARIGHHEDRRYENTYDFFTADHESHFSGNLGWSPDAERLLYERLRY